MIKLFLLSALAQIAVISPLAGQTAGDPVLKTASHHAMKYYVSLPQNWSLQRKWPVVVVIEAAEKEFLENAKRFSVARKAMPFIIVAPIIVSNGNYGLHDDKVYPYNKATWDQIDQEGGCKFDMDGILQVLADVEKEFGGESKSFITGFESGGHVVWGMTFLHPEKLKAALPIAGNYRGRCVDETSISKDAARKSLVIKGFYGLEDKDWGPGNMLFGQWMDAKKIAIAHGYENVTELGIPGKAHVPLPSEALELFYTLL